MKEVEKYLQELVDRDKSPGVTYHVFNSHDIVYEFIRGFADVGKKRKLTNATTFHAFSVTKTFTALAILKLCEQKKLEIERPAHDFLTDFPYTADITIRQLLTHSAGIPNPIPLSWIHLPGEHSSFNRNQFFNTIFSKHNKPKSAPNEKYSYSNLGYVLLGRIIEQVAETGYEQYITENIIERLDLEANDLGFEINDPGEHATGYIRQISFSNMLLGLFIDKQKYMAKPEGRWQPFKDYYVNGPSYGGLIGTANAFVKYVQELIKPDCSILSSDLKKKLFTENFTRDNKPTGMCMSWFSGRLDRKQYFAHAGGGGGYYCEIRLYPDFEMGSVIMFNRTGMKDARFLNSVDKYFLTD